MAAVALASFGCGTTPEIPSLDSGDTQTDDDDSGEDDSSGTPPTTETMTMTSVSATGPGTTTTVTETDSGSTTLIDVSTTMDTSEESSSSSSGGSSSSTGLPPDEDVQCDGPEADDMCDTPSPYDGEGECDPYAQDCPDGEKCMPWANDGGTSWNATRCSAIDPTPDGLGEDCTVEGSGVSGIDSCDIGLMCWNVDPETNVGVCIELCGCGPDEPTCPSGGAICSITNDGALPICLPTCDPLGYDGTEDICEDNEVCVPVAGWFICAPDVSGGEGQVGDSCDFLNVCDPGLMCADSSLVPGCVGNGCCTEFCDTGEGNSQCSNNLTECVPFFEAGEEPEECHEDTGLCIDPD